MTKLDSLDWKNTQIYSMTDYDRAIEDFNSRGDTDEFNQWYLREFGDRETVQEDFSDLELLVENYDDFSSSDDLELNYWIIPKEKVPFGDILKVIGYKSYQEEEESIPFIRNYNGTIVARVEGKDKFSLSPDYEENKKDLKSYLLEVDEFRGFLDLNDIKYTLDEEGFDKMAAKLRRDSMEKIRDEIDLADRFSKDNGWKF